MRDNVSLQLYTIRVNISDLAHLFKMVWLARCNLLKSANFITYDYVIVNLVLRKGASSGG